MAEEQRNDCHRCAKHRANGVSGQGLLYHQPNAFAFGWMQSSGSFSNLKPWLMQDSIRFPFSLLADPPQFEASLQASGEKTYAHCDSQASEIACCQMWLEVSRRYFCYKAGGSAALPSCLLDDCCIQATQARRHGELAQVFIQALHYRGHGMAAAVFYEAKACEVIAYLMETLTLVSSTKSIVDNPDAADQLGIERVTLYLNDHLDQELPMNRLCALACMGKTKLKQCFRNSHQCTLSEYLIARRIGEAQRLLRVTNLAVSEIAQAVGYHAGGRFAILFKRHTGYLPSEYRSAFR